jgi:hypothetical protein
VEFPKSKVFSKLRRKNYLLFRLAATNFKKDDNFVRGNTWLSIRLLRLPSLGQARVNGN